MPSLFTREPVQAKTGVARGVSGAISVSLQLAFGLVVVSLTGVANPDVTRAPIAGPRLLSPVFVSPPPVDVPIPAAPELKAPVEVKVPEPVPERPALVAVREFENKAVSTPAVAEVRAVDAAPRPAPPAPVPTPPKVAVGAFDTPAAAARAPEPVRRVETAGFAAAVPAGTPKGAPYESRPPTVGAFDSAPAPGARQPGASSDRVAMVAESGFTQTSAAAPPTQQSRVIREAGFGTTSSQERPKAQDAAVKTSGFGDARVVEPARRAEVVAKSPSVIPVEVLSKPTPIYTDEARKLKIEGEVVLEVEFCSTGAVRILRVVRGLGHGLDESATTAAQKIQFKPATSEGRPVDYKTTVRIEFRLA